MSETIACPRCGRKLNVQEEYLGQAVQCPACNEQFTAEPPPLTARPVMLPPAGEPPPPRGRLRRDDDYDRRPRRDYDYDDYGDRRYERPDRGGVILTLGIVGLVLSCIPLAGWILGGIALSMGNTDLGAMARGTMNRAGQGTTQAGKVCGLIAVILSSVFFLLACFLRLGAPRW
jgi:hypothetical protein